MSAKALPPESDEQYRRILGLRFFVGDAPEAVAKVSQGGLVVAPAAPSLVELGRDHEYRQALEQAVSASEGAESCLAARQWMRDCV